MRKKSIVFISGIGPSATGTGMFLDELIRQAKELDSSVLKFIFKEKTPRYRGLAKIKKINPIRLFRYILGQTNFSSQCLREVQYSDVVVLMHPQTIGFEIFKKIILGRSCTWIYVLDSFIFCRRSYNYIIGENQPCLRCVGNEGKASIEMGCFDWFNSGPFHSSFPEWVNSGRLRLIVQSESQARLLRTHFGVNAFIIVVPLFVPDLDSPRIESEHLSRLRPQIVFHGTCQPAKGISLIVVLARMMPECDFIVPSNIQDYRNYYKSNEALPENLLFRPSSWDQGLQNLVTNADLVICPSAWSAAVEGAILKSLVHNGLVAVFPHESSYASEIPIEARLEINPLDWAGTVEGLQSVLRNPQIAKLKRDAARRYVTNYINLNHSILEKIISIVLK